jgi:uncharacterized protein (TIGR02147 family)
MAYANHISVFEFDDYVELLKALIEARKSEGLPFSFRWFSQKAGFTSPNYLHLVLAKKRHLSSEAANAASEIFRLGTKESEYFKLLVEFNKAKTPTSRSEVGQKMIQLRAKSKTQYLNKSQMSYYLSWQNIAIRECLLLNRDGLTAQDISKHVFPHPSQKEIQQTLETLLALELVEQTADGHWRARGGNISSGDRVDSSALVGYHLQMMDLAKESLDRFSSKERDISNVSVPLSKDNFEKIRGMIQDVRAEALRLSAENVQSDLVAQINFQLFPLASKKDINS